MAIRVYLRAFEPDDYKISILWRKDDEIWDMLGGTKYFVSESYEKEWVLKTISNTKDIKLAVCTKDTDLYIGNIYITDIDMINRTCQSHILIGDKKYWGKGIAKEALIQILYYVFYDRGLNRVMAYILEDNVTSIRMHEKCGYKKEGIMRSSVFKNGMFKNQVIMSVLKDDFEKN